MQTRLLALCALVCGLIATIQPTNAKQYAGDIDAAVAETIREMRFEREWERISWEKQIVSESNYELRWERKYTERQQWWRQCTIVKRSDTVYVIAYYEDKLWLDSENVFSFSFKLRVQPQNSAGLMNSVPTYRITLYSRREGRLWKQFKEVCDLPNHLDDLK